MKVQKWKLTGKVVCCAVSPVLFAVNSIVLITLFRIIISVLIARIIDSFKYRQYTVVFGKAFPTSTKTVAAFDLEFRVGVGDVYLYG
jgi:hypothetical protein